MVLITNTESLGRFYGRIERAVVLLSEAPETKGAVRLASTVMVQVGDILKILNLAKFQSIF